ncbi:MAG: hypothetical protein CMJ58_12615 [Planctomycetaceae bacterium]|nr:hypothetical protein [Planctomycetaceae bacterium]
MLTIALGSSKGGVGKSTLATNIAVELHDAGIPVTLVDAEEGSPTASLLEEHVPDIDTRAVSSQAETARIVDELRAAGRVVIIDSPGKTGRQLTAACMLADVFLLAMKVCERDLLQSGAALAVIRSCQLQHEGRPQAFIVYNETARDDAEASSFTRQLKPLGIPVAAARIRPQRTVRRNTTIMRGPLRTSGAASDIRSLVEEVIVPRLVAATQGGVNG